jgi:hypothetical protein
MNHLREGGGGLEIEGARERRTGGTQIYKTILHTTRFSQDYSGKQY